MTTHVIIVVIVLVALWIIGGVSGMKFAAGICVVLIVVIMYACCAMAGQIDDWENRR